MDDDGDCQMSFCADLVTLRKTEAFPLSLLNDRQPGEWVAVKTVCQLTGTDSKDVKPELVSTWLPDPFGDPDYVVMIFYDDETKQSFAAHYNKRRLLNAYPAASTGGEKDHHSVLGTGS
jgi:hypothetical protein